MVVELLVVGEPVAEPVAAPIADVGLPLADMLLLAPAVLDASVLAPVAAVPAPVAGGGGGVLEVLEDVPLVPLVVLFGAVSGLLRLQAASDNVPATISASAAPRVREDAFIWRAPLVVVCHILWAASAASPVWHSRARGHTAAVGLRC